MHNSHKYTRTQRKHPGEEFLRDAFIIIICKSQKEGAFVRRL